MNRPSALVDYAEVAMHVARSSLTILFLSLCICGHDSSRASDGAPSGEAIPAPLVTRNRIQLNLAGAEKILAAARRQAVKMGLKLNIAVVDDGGHLIAFARMDGARPASGYTALTKATTAATFR